MIASGKNMEAIIKAVMTEKGLVDLCSQDTVHEAEVSGRVDFGDVFITVADLCGDRSEEVDLLISAFNDDGVEVFSDNITGVSPADLSDAIKELLDIMFFTLQMKSSGIAVIDDTPRSWGYRK